MYFDDNFGDWDMNDDPEETLAFYHQVQRESVATVCSICERTVMLRPEYDKCNSCVDSIESGSAF